MSWSGDLVSYSGLAIFVGLPLARAPIWLASALPFVLAAAAMTLAAVVIMHPKVLRPHRAWQPVLALVLVIPSTWWAYWWSGPALAGDPQARQFANGITFWQTLNGQYVIPTALVTTAWVLLGRMRPRQTWLFLMLMMALGLAIGFIGPVFALGVILGLPLLGLSLLLLGRIPSPERLLGSTLLWFMTIVGAAASHWSPGSRARALGLPHPLVNEDFVLVQVKSMPLALSQWWGAVWTAGALVTLSVIAFLAYLLRRRGVRFDVRRLVSFGVGSVAFSLILILVNRVAEAFAYQAFWHELQTRMFVWIALIAFGAAAGSWIADRDLQSAWAPALFVTAMVGIILSLAAVASLTGAMAARSSAWKEGPAPLPGISDIEVDWIHSSWQELVDHGRFADR